MLSLSLHTRERRPTNKQGGRGRGEEGRRRTFIKVVGGSEVVKVRRGRKSPRTRDGFVFLVVRKEEAARPMNTRQSHPPAGVVAERRGGEGGEEVRYGVG
jgi:hypothetical protein